MVNRGQRDIETGKPIAAALEYERKFFETHPSYSNKAQYCGTPFLARKLNVVRSKFVDHLHTFDVCFRSSWHISALPSQTSSSVSQRSWRNTTPSCSPLAALWEMVALLMLCCQ